MNALLKFVALIASVLLIVWGGALISLGFAGETSPAKQVTVRREGGARSDSAPNRYTWYISYDFTTRDGKTFSGNTQSIGDANGVSRPTRIAYLPAFPYINAPADQTGVRPMPLILIGAGIVVFGGIARSRRPRRRSPKPNKVRPTPRAAPPSHKPKTDVATPSLQASNPDAKAWLARYRKNARRYAWGFFILIVIMIGGLVRYGLDDWNAEWASATGFAAFVT